MPFRHGLATPERSVPSSPTLSPAVVSHTTATTRHLHSNDDVLTVDISELTRLLQKAASSRSTRAFHMSKPPSPAASATSSTSSSASTCNTAPSTTYPSSQLAPQFVFRKPEYNQEYHRTHFHRPALERKDAFLGWYDLRRFFAPTEPNNNNSNDTFGNQFRQDIEGRYGKWGKQKKSRASF